MFSTGHQGRTIEEASSVELGVGQLDAVGVPVDGGLHEGVEGVEVVPVQDEVDAEGEVSFPDETGGFPLGLESSVAGDLVGPGRVSMMDGAQSWVRDEATASRALPLRQKLT
ncbi:hypothetical protein [Streptomyces tendae]|uniref:hypothetical protein n=1 Tax=Streptomyces tendae TaxID=1932 RepID=UPI00366A46AB